MSKRKTPRVASIFSYTFCNTTYGKQVKLLFNCQLTHGQYTLTRPINRCIINAPNEIVLWFLVVVFRHSYSRTVACIIIIMVSSFKVGVLVIFTIVLLLLLHKAMMMILGRCWLRTRHGGIIVRVYRRNSVCQKAIIIVVRVIHCIFRFRPWTQQRLVFSRCGFDNGMHNGGGKQRGLGG